MPYSAENLSTMLGTEVTYDQGDHLYHVQFKSPEAAKRGTELFNERIQNIGVAGAPATVKGNDLTFSFDTGYGLGKKYDGNDGPHKDLFTKKFSGTPADQIGSRQSETPFYQRNEDKKAAPPEQQPAPPQPPAVAEKEGLGEDLKHADKSSRIEARNRHLTKPDREKLHTQYLEQNREQLKGHRGQLKALEVELGAQGKFVKENGDIDVKTLQGALGFHTPGQDGNVGGKTWAALDKAMHDHHIKAPGPAA